MSVSVGIVGYGYWGPNLARNFSEFDQCQVAAIADTRPARLAQAAKRYPGTDMVADGEKLIRSPKVDAVVVATPVSSHYPLAKAALEAGKHVLIEKPLTSTSEQAEELVELAERKNLVLMVDHTFVYTGAVRKIRELVNGGWIGKPLYFDSMRINLGLFQPDVSVLWDLAPHDVSIMDSVLGLTPQGLTAGGSRHFGSPHETIAFLTIYYPDDLVAHINVSWISPMKMRLMLIGGDSKMIVYDDTEPSEKVKVYDRGVDMTGGKDSIYEMLVQYRVGDIWTPRLDGAEALRTEVAHFLDCVTVGKRPITDGPSGLRVVKLLEAADRSLRNRGEYQELAL